MCRRFVEILDRAEYAVQRLRHAPPRVVSQVARVLRGDSDQAQDPASTGLRHILVSFLFQAFLDTLNDIAATGSRRSPPDARSAMSW